MYLNRLYFRSDTGEFIFRNYMQGGIARIPTVDEDFNTFESLKSYVKEAVTVVELEEGKYSDDFSLILDPSTHLRLNPQTKELEFKYPIPEEFQLNEMPFEKPLTMQVMEMKEAIAELTMMIAAINV